MKRDEKGAMVRIAVREGKVVPDLQAGLAGRGGYLHRRPECLEAFVGSKAREFRSLRRRIDRDERRELVRNLEQRLAQERIVEYNR